MATTRKVRPGEEFVFCSGATAATIAQCRTELGRLTNEQFEHHVNGTKNDIYNWLRDCLDPELAQKIRNVTDRTELIRALAAPAPKRKKA